MDNDYFKDTQQKIIAVDFDSTCVAHLFPEVGAEIGAAPVLRRLAAKGHKIILWTVRSGNYLQPAIQWFVKNEIPLYGICENPQQKSWSSSPKCHADLFIDDLGACMPLLNDSKLSPHPFVNWDILEKWLILNKYL